MGPFQAVVVILITPRPHVLVALTVPLAHCFPALRPRHSSCSRNLALAVLVVDFSLITGLPLSVPPRRLIVPPSRSPIALLSCRLVSCCLVVSLSRCLTFLLFGCPSVSLVCFVFQRPRYLADTMTESLASRLDKENGESLRGRRWA